MSLAETYSESRRHELRTTRLVMTGRHLAVSRERIDTGTWLLPWVRVGRSQFS